MISIAVLVAFLGLSSATDPGCCTPDYWEGLMSYETATVIPGTSVPSIQEGQLHLSIDGIRKRHFATGTVVTNGVSNTISVLRDFVNDEMYTVVDGNCTKANSAGVYPGNCVPANATKSASGFLGANPTLAVDQYKFGYEDMTIYLTVNEECIPVAETYYGTSNKNNIISQNVFTEMKGGVANPDVFNLPAACRGSFSQSGTIIGKRSYTGF